MSLQTLERAGKTFISMPRGARIAITCAMALLAAGTAWLVYATGGARFAYLHLMYVPVVVCALVNGTAGGVIAGIAGGILLGPLIPIDSSTGEPQEPFNWIYRLLFLVLIGALVGMGAQLLRRHLSVLAWMHEHHSDTGLLNISGLMRNLESMIRTASPVEKLVVSVTQFNNFLEIQNTFGAGFGTRLLRCIVERARDLVPRGSLIALIQPDRLATVVVGEDAAREVGTLLDDAIRESFVVDGVPIHVEVSIGVAHFPTHAPNPEELLQKASIAMHSASMRKSPLLLYDTAKDRTSRDNLVLLGALPDAILRGELRIWHQAKTQTATGRVVGAEALVRWQHPERGLVLPECFIPQVEETTLINAMTHWVISAAFADAAEWRAHGYPLRASVNLSMRNLRDRMLFDVLAETARRHGLRPTDVELEITESAVMSDPDHCIRLITQLRDHGYCVCIDDFGIGQSSLGYLQKLHVSGLKIDQTFVKTLSGDTGNQKIVRSILHLAESMGLETTAEGVEDESSLALLREWGCSYAQGYLIHRPAPSSDLLRLLASRPGTPAAATSRLHG